MFFFQSWLLFCWNNWVPSRRFPCASYDFIRCWIAWIFNFLWIHLALFSSQVFSCGNGRNVPATSCARLPRFFVIWSEPLLQRGLGVLMGKRLTTYFLITIHEWLRRRIRFKSVRSKTDSKDIVVKPHHWWSWNIIIWRWCWQSGTQNCQQQETSRDLKPRES